MRLLVTGATGFLGSRIVRGLLLEGHQVVVLKRSCSNITRIADLLGDVRVFDLDRCAPGDPFRAGGGTVDAVVHCATCYGRAGESTAALVEADVAFPVRLLDAAAQAGVGLFVNTDTVLPKDINAYALAKSHFRDWARYFAERAEIDVINLRLDHFFGPGDDPSKFTAFVIGGCLANRQELALTAGEQLRDFIYIDDVVAAYLRLLRDAGAPRPGFREFDVGSGQPVTVRHFVETAHRLSRSSTQLRFGALPYRPHEPMQVRLDSAPLRALGWMPRHSLEDGILATMAGMPRPTAEEAGR